MITWIVPLIAKDLGHLELLMEAISIQSLRVGELIIVSSGLTSQESAEVDRQVANSTFDARHLRRRRLHSAGSNRNFGVRKAHGDLVSFIDADDIPHPKRNEMLQTQFGWPGKREKMSNTIVLHSFFAIYRDQVFPNSSWRECFAEIDLASLRVAKTIREDALAEIFSTRPNSRMPQVHLAFEEGSVGSVHHASITLSRDQARKFPIPSRPISRDEDVLYLNEQIRRGFQIEFLDTALILYRVGWLTPPTFSEDEYLVPFPRLLRLIKIYRNVLKLMKRGVRGIRRSAIRVTKVLAR